MEVEKLRNDLKLDEGIELYPYKDTVGKITIGIGRNLTDRGITSGEAMFMLNNDIAIAVSMLDVNVPWWKDMPEECQRALANMCFNMGWPTLSKFVNMLASLEEGQYREAATHALNSRWAMQVGARATRIAELYKKGSI